jgi:trk system potassium uptake protein TrkH
MSRMQALPQSYTAEEAFRHSLFQVVSLMTTAGYTTTDYGVWPLSAMGVLIVVMFLGGMAGSTGGGIKTSRIVIAVKGMLRNIRLLIQPRCIAKPKFEGKTLEDKTVNDVFAFFTMYGFLLVGVTVLLGFDGICGQSVTVLSDAGEYTVSHGFFSNFTAALACLSNVGPAFEAAGPYASYAGFSYFSKVLLSLTMLIGRLEILPVLLLFSPKTWRKV